MTIQNYVSWPKRKRNGELLLLLLFIFILTNLISSPLHLSHCLPDTDLSFLHATHPHGRGVAGRSLPTNEDVMSVIPVTAGKEISKLRGRRGPHFQTLNVRRKQALDQKQFERRTCVLRSLETDSHSIKAGSECCSCHFISSLNIQRDELELKSNVPF